MILLKNVLYTAGQKDLGISEKINVNRGDLVDMVAFLAQGYYHLYTNPYNDKPFRYFNQAYLISKKLGMHEAEKFCLISILEVYNFEIAQSNEDAIEFLNAFEDLASDTADQYHFKMNLVQFNLRDIFFKVQLDEVFFNEFDELMNNFSADHNFWPNYYSSKGVFFETLGKTSESVELHQLAITMIDDEPFLKYIKFRSNIRLSEISRKHGEHDTALEYINEAEKSSDSSDTTRSQYYIQYYLSRIYEESKDYKNAYLSLSQSNDLKNALDYEKNTLEIARLNVLYQAQEKEKLLLEQERELLLEKQRKARTTTIALVLGITLALGLAISLLIYRDTKRKQLLAIQEKDIEANKVTNLLRDQELIALNAMIEGQETERKRIAEDLHDRLGSTLSAVKMHMDVLADEEPKYAKINAIVDKAVNDTREIAHNMLSGVLTKFGLMAALQDLKETIESANQFKIILQSIQFDGRLATDRELHIYRIVQELISNTLKHGQASMARVTLEMVEPKELTIKYVDDGIGFDLSNVQKGMGLKNIESRVDKIDGIYKIYTTPSKGLEVVIKLKV
ncbi:MAG: sensor histidine kinase [Cyclobacteriaceae bacterium]